MFFRRIPSTPVKIPQSVYYGALAGILFGLLFNHGRWNCLRPLPNMDQVYKTREPNIPREFLKNLSEPKPPISGGRKFILEPWRVMNQVNTSKSKHFMIFLISASALDAKLRFLSRLTWASVGDIEGRRIGAIFVIPGAINDAQDKLLAAENEIHGDILQANLDLEEKARESLWILSGYQWCAENVGNRAEYFVNVDSESFPFLPNIHEYTRNSEGNSLFASSVHCGFKRGPVHKPRQPTLKSYVNRRVYNESYFPSYCDPSIVITSQALMKDLFHISMVTNLGPIPQGDVFVWGILREKLRAGGEKNIVDVSNTFTENNLKPLSYKVNFKTASASKEVQRLWSETKKQFSLSENDSIGENTKPRVSLLNIPVSDPKQTIESDMKTFIRKWGRVPMKKSKPNG